MYIKIVFILDGCLIIYKLNMPQILLLQKSFLTVLPPNKKVLSKMMNTYPRKYLRELIGMIIFYR